MKTTTSKRTWKAIYRLLDHVNPLSHDCGELCDAACCMADDPIEADASDAPEMGIYLFPGEEKIHSRKETWLKWSVERAEDYDFPDSWVGEVYFVKCTTPPVCPRERRPLQCRTYPLAPHITEDGILTLVRNTEDLPYTCPLILGDMSLKQDFVKATYTVWKHLVRDPLIYDLVEMDSRQRDLLFGDQLKFEPLP